MDDVDSDVPPKEQLQHLRMPDPDSTVPPTEQLPSIQDGAAPLPVQQTEQEEKEEKHQEPTGQPMIEDLSLSAQNEQDKQDGQKKTLKRSLEFVHEIVELFGEKDKEETNETADGSDASHESTAEFLQKTETIKKKWKQPFDDDKKKSTMIVQLQTNLDRKAKGNRREAERRLAEADKIHKLVSEFKTNVRRLEDQQRLVPTEELKKKLAMGKTLLLWLEERLEQLQDLVGNKDLASYIVAWNRDILSQTFWDRSPKDKTTLGSKPVDDFDNIKVERIIFNPMRTTFLSFIGYLCNRACDHAQYGAIKSTEGRFDKILKCDLLEHQTDAAKQPPRWIVLEMRHEDATADMYMRSDNLYIGGFSNKNKQIYEFGNKGNPPLLKGSIPFGCDCDYPSLMNYERAQVCPDGQDVERLKELLLSARATSSDIVAMSEYDHTIEGSIEPEAWLEILKQVHFAIGRTAVVVPEVCRFLVLCAYVDGDWMESGSYLNDLLIAYMRNWKVISFAIRNGPEERMFTETQIKEFGLTYVFEAFEVLRLALNTKGDGLPTKDNRESQDDGGKGGSKPPPGTKKEGGDDSQGGGGHGNDKVEPHGDGGNDTDKVPTKGVICSTTAKALVGRSTEDVYISSEEGTATTSPIKFQLCGQPLVEVFRIYTNNQFVKSIAIYDDRSGNFIYKSKDIDIRKISGARDIWMSNNTGRDSSDFLAELDITGPDRAMSALPGFIIEVDVGDENGVYDLSWNWGDRTVVDKIMIQNIFTSRGDVHVISAVMSNAVQASVEVALIFPNPSLFSPNATEDPLAGYLEVIIDDFPIGCAIFHGVAHLTPMPSLKNMAEETCEADVMWKLPLTRDVLVLPVGCRLRVFGSLSVGLDTTIAVDQSIKLEDQVGWSKLHCESRLPDLLVGAAIRINTVSPF